MTLFYCIARRLAQKDRFIYEVEKGGAVPSGAENVEKQAGVDASTATESAKQKGADMARAQQEKLVRMLGLKSAAREVTERVDKTEVLEKGDRVSELTGFPEAEKLQTEVVDYNGRTQELHKEGSEISANISNFQKAYQRFEAGKKEVGVFLRGSPFVDDDETEQLNHQLQVLRRSLAQKLQDLKIKQHQLEEEGKGLVKEGQELRKQKEGEKNKKLSEVDAQGTEIDKTKKKNEGQYNVLEIQQKKLYGEREKLKNYRDGLEQQSSAATQSGEAIKVKEEQVREFQGNLDESIKILDEALAKNPPSPQKETLLAKREELLKHKEESSGGMKELAGAKEKTEAAGAEIQGQLDVATKSEMNINDHLNRSVNPSLSVVDKSIEELEIAKLRNGTQHERIEVEYVEIFQVIDIVNTTIAENVLANNIANKQVIASTGEQIQSLDAISIDRPGVWDASGGLLFSTIGEGSTLLTKDLVCQTFLDPMSRFIKKTTKNIPVVNIIAEVGTNIVIDLPSGVIEGVGELVSGVAVMVAHPLEAAKGMVALAGRNPQTGEWSFSQAGDTWKELGKVSIAYENFKEGQWGKGVGKVALNVLLTATGAGAVAKGAQGASIAYGVARVGGAGAMRAGLRATGTGAGIFAREATSGLSKLPGEALSGIGKLLKTPTKLADCLRLDKATRLGKEISEMNDELGGVSKKLDDFTVSGKKVEDFYARRITNLYPIDLAEIGLTNARAISEFLEYKSILQKSEQLKGSIRDLVHRKEIIQAAPELEMVSKLKGDRLKRFIVEFNSKHPEGLSGNPFMKVQESKEGILAFNANGQLEIFSDVAIFEAKRAEYFEPFFSHPLGHGSTSSSLIGTVKEGGLVPVGELIQKGNPPFSGELEAGISQKGVNRVGVSLTRDFHNRGGLDIDYALGSSVNVDTSGWTITKGNERIKELERYVADPMPEQLAEMGISAQQYDARYGSVYRMQLEIERLRLAAFENLSPFERELVQHPFPVIYKVTKEVEYVDPMRKFGILTGDEGYYKGTLLFGDHIKAVFVPDEKISMVKNYFTDKGRPDVVIAPLEVIPKYRRAVKQIEERKRPKNKVVLRKAA